MKKKTVKLRDYKSYTENRYDEMKKFLDISRSLNARIAFHIR